MGVFNGAFPIRAGKEEDAREFAAETSGARRPGFEARPPPAVLIDYQA
jgi:hypothetical protein